jgi:uncharacterized protein (TIGR02611 family)
MSEATEDTTDGRSKPAPAARWVWFPVKAVGLFIARNGKRIAVAIAGFTLILVGAALLVLPGPGWLVIFLGLAVLATEFVWAERMLNVAKEKARQAKDKVLRKKESEAGTETPGLEIQEPDQP